MSGDRPCLDVLEVNLSLVAIYLLVLRIEVDARIASIETKAMHRLKGKPSIYVHSAIRRRLVDLRCCTRPLQLLIAVVRAL